MINEKQSVKSKTKTKPKYKQQPINKAWSYVIVGLIIVFFTLITILGVYQLIVKKPDVDTNVPFTVDVPKSQGIDLELNMREEQTGFVFTRRPDVYNFLFAGLSEQTDAMMVLSYDVAEQNLSVVQIPRDTYINAGRNFHKINSYYTGEHNRLVKSGVDRSEVNSLSMESLADFIQENMNIKIDFWVLFDLQGFKNIVDILGGVEVDIPFDMYYEDPEQDLYIDLKAGVQILDGDKSEQFVRYRDGYALADKGRMDAQKIFMTQFMKKVKSSLSIDTVTKITQQAVEYVTMSLTPQQCVYFAAELLNINFDNVTMMTLPASSVYNPDTGAWYEVLNRYDALSMINNYLNVYEQDIPDEIFDMNKTFTNEGQRYINDTYNSSPGSSSGEMTASEIAENSIHIQHN